MEDSFRGSCSKKSEKRWLCLTFVFTLIVLVLIGCGGGGGGSSSSSSSAPVITTQPASQSVSVGSAVAFSVVATGSNLTYQWYKIDSSTSQGVAVSGATSSAFVLSSTALTDSGDYYVVVSNSAGLVTSSTATLTVSSNTGDGTVSVS